MHRLRILFALASALAVLAFVVAAAVPAGAATTGAYAPRGARGAARPAAAPVSPSGCWQQIDNPHKSKYFGDIAAELRTTCRNPIPEIAQSVQLWESRWWGWDRVGSKGSVHVYWESRVTSWSNASCRNSSMRATGSGTIVDLDGDKYYASTASPSVKNPCKL